VRTSQNLARTVKRAARPLVGLVGEPLAGVAEWLLRRTSSKAGVAVAYHVIGDRTGEPATELVPAHGVGLYEAQVRHLNRRYRVVAAADLPAAVAARRRGERFPATITFDDDLAPHVQVALPVLARVGVSATFFLSGASLTAPFSFWWERLQRAVGSSVPVPSTSLGGPAQTIEPRQVRVVGVAVEKLAPADRERWSDELLMTLGGEPADAGLRAAAVRELAAAGMTIGFHTRRHDSMPALDDAQLAAALSDGRAELEELAGARLAVIGYPHGHADERVAAAARAAGFDVGYTTAEQAVTPASDTMLLGRINPSYRSTGHFALQLVGALTAAHR
jgi:peptidoglycan/xylan/chitin deacetylase (PgdA/CDA1 family)